MLAMTPIVPHKSSPMRGCPKASRRAAIGASHASGDRNRKHAQSMGYDSALVENVPEGRFKIAILGQQVFEELNP